MSKKYINVRIVLHYIAHSLTEISRITGCVSIYASLVCILIEITGFTIGLKSCVITAGITKYKSIIKEKKKKYNKSVLLAKPEWNSIEVLTLEGFNLFKY